MDPIDSPSRFSEIRETLQRKPALSQFYRGVYQRYAECLTRCPDEGRALEIGSGAGFAKEHIPELITSDVVPYQGVDCVVDAMHLPFADSSLRLICMTNVFHHICDVSAFFTEATRCLIPGGRLLIVDQHRGIISRPVLRYIHSEPYDDKTERWAFQTTGPLSGANGALAWIVFVRDVARFSTAFPKLKLLRYEPHSPLWYWLSGGLKTWSALPRSVWRPVRALEAFLLAINRNLGSFVDIELVNQRARTDN
jgi:SAM-dependent methyltransferase